MKIYNKNGFFKGLFWLILGGSSLITMVYRGMELPDVLWCTIEFGMAIYYITRSFSRNMSDADQDERTQLIVQKSRSTAYTWVKGICIVLGLLYMMVFSHTKNDLHLGIAVCFAIVLIVMMIVQGITEVYYDSKL